MESHQTLNRFIYAFVLLHFLKRILETLLYVLFIFTICIYLIVDNSVHRFSHATMPFSNVFKKYASYNILSTLSPASSRDSNTLQLSTLPYPMWSVPPYPSHLCCLPYQYATTRITGVSLAYAIYSPTYSATSSYIRRTIRDDPNFLWAGAAVWLVSHRIMCLASPFTTTEIP